jgi:hypothetical protein
MPTRPPEKLVRAKLREIAARYRSGRPGPDIDRLAPGVFMFAVPNGGYRRPLEAAIMKATGTVAGVPDIICIFQGRVYALELKAGRGRLTDVQRVVHERLREAGANVAVAHGIDHALAQLEAWNLLRHNVARRPGAHSPAHQSNRSNEK